MTFPLELAQIDSPTYVSKNDYLYPLETMEIRQMVQEYCDRMEYDGSMMYDEYPDKVSMERLAEKISRDLGDFHQEEISEKWLRYFIQIMLCGEMSYRRERRKCHKANLYEEID